jgi:uracil phosphoribosyltransferase
MPHTSTGSASGSMELEHSYGPQVHILDNSFLNGLLARLCHPETFQPEITRIVEALYTNLMTVVMNNEFDHEQHTQITRMSEYHPEQMLTTKRIVPNQKAVSINLARAGTFPSHICYNFMHFSLLPQNIRQDHIFAARTTDIKETVTGTHLDGMKIGGGVDKACVLFPDPMGATGNTMISAVDYYKKNVPGTAKKYLALNLIVTPEYLKNLLAAHPDVVIYALRLDRGLSPQAVLNAPAGKHWDQERGLNDKQYIVPGGGGFGEIMNNSFV